MPRRLGVVASSSAVAGLLAVASAQAAVRFIVEPTAATAGVDVTVRLDGTPPSFALTDRQPPFQKAIRMYLAPRRVASEIRSRSDPRLSFVGRIVPDRDGRGVLRFRAPPLDSGAYALAYWCPGCPERRRGRAFGVETARALRLRLPPALPSCPVSGEGRYGNYFVSVTLPPNGVLARPREADGTLFDKLGWLPREGFSGHLTVRGERLDAPGRLKVLSVNWGYAYVPGRPPRGSWMSAVKFPDEGCWRLTGRVDDISLTYVVKVVART